MIRVPLGQRPIALHVDDVADAPLSSHQDAVDRVVLARRQSALHERIYDLLRGLLLALHFQQLLGGVGNAHFQERVRPNAAAWTTSGYRSRSAAGAAACNPLTDYV